MHKNSSEMSRFRDKNDDSRRRRNLQLLAGGAAGSYGFWRRDRLGHALLLSGAFLIYRAASRKVPEYFAFKVSQTINRQPAEVYAYWRDFNNWPLFMESLMNSSGFQRPKVTPDPIHVIEDLANKLFRWRSKQREAM